MAIADSLLPEFDHEMGTTRRLLERVPEDQPEWRPHPKSMMIGRLAMHLAELPGMVPIILTQSSFDSAPAGGSGPPRAQFESREQLLAVFDRNVAAARAGIASQSDASLRETWTLQRGGTTMLSLPRAGVLRTFLLNHMIHHRGQLSVYLRLNDVPLPSVYGPTADLS